MKNYVGIKFGQLSEQEQKELLKNPHPVNGITGDVMRGEGECIIDLTSEYSVPGRLVQEGDNLVIKIEDDAIIYNPASP